MTAPDIRKATVDDLPALTQLADVSWRAANADALPQATLDALSRNHSLAGLMASRWTSIWVADTGARLDGMAAADDEGHIWLMYVNPDAQGQGIGSALLDHITDLVGKHARAATLDVLEGNTHALAFYTARGWTEESRREVPLPGSVCTAIRLTKALTPAS